MTIDPNDAPVRVEGKTLKERRAQRKELRKTHKKCSKCREWKPLERFGQHDGNADGKQVICYSCKNDAAKQDKSRNALQRIKHAITTRTATQLGEYAPEHFARDLEKYLGWKFRTLEKHLRRDLREREGPKRKLRDALDEGYHIDHIKPLMLFKVVDPELGALFGDDGVDWEAFRECWSVENLSAIPGSENLAKGAKYSDPVQGKS